MGNLTSPNLLEADMRRDRQADRISHLLFRMAEQLSRQYRSRDDAVGRLIPTMPALFRSGVDECAKHLGTQNRPRAGRSYLGCGGSSDLGWRTFGPPERAPHGIHDNVLGPAYHFLRQVAIRQLQRIVAEMIEDSVGHFLLGRAFAEVWLKFFSWRQRKHYIIRTNRPPQMRQGPRRKFD